MAEATKSETAASGPGTWFTTTRWSLVLNAQDTPSPLAAAALEKLCRAYWYPLYVYLRRQGEDEESAKDLTQGFFARLRQRYRELVRDEVANTVESPEEVDGEIRHLISVISG